MIEYLENKNILKSKAQVLVNPVNCIGIMGRGLALQFKIAFPENYSAYKQACNKGEVKIGSIFVYRVKLYNTPEFIFNFPTKYHFINESSYNYIELGIQAMLREMDRLRIKSIAIPSLGCGLGKLEWKKVKVLFERYFDNNPSQIFEIYTPKES